VIYRQRYPLVDVQMAIGNTDDVVRALNDGAAELGFIEGTTEDPAIIAHEVARDQLVLVVSVAHPWANRRDIRAVDFPKSEWVIREIGSGTRAQLEAALESHGLQSPRPRCRARIAIERGRAGSR